MGYKLTEDSWVRIVEGELEVKGQTFRYQFSIPVPQSLPAEDEEAYMKDEEAKLVYRVQRQLDTKVHLLGYLAS